MNINVEKPAVCTIVTQDWLIQLPVTPSSLTIKNDNQNEDLISVDGTPVTIAKRDKAQKFTLSFIFPYALHNTLNEYWCFTNFGLDNLKDFTDKLWTVKQERTPITLTITYSNGSSLNGQFLLDDYEYTQDAENGSDYDFSISLTEYYPAKNYELSGQLVNSLLEYGIRNPRRLD